MTIQQKFWQRISLVLITIFAFLGIVSAQDTVVLDTLTLLESGDSGSAAFNDEINTHLYAFHATAGDVVSIVMTQTSEDLDPLLVLLDANGAVLASDDDSGSVQLAAAITDFEIPDDGTYLILATSTVFLEGTDSPSDELEYTLSLVGNTTPDDFVATEVELGATELEYGNIVESESSDDAPAAFFVFEGAAGDIVAVQVESDTFPTVLYVFDPSGARLAVDPSAITGLELTEDGTYLILAADVFFYEAAELDTFFEGGVFVLALNRQ
jgi:hypothetical protein